MILGLLGEGERERPGDVGGLGGREGGPEPDDRVFGLWSWSQEI